MGKLIFITGGSRSGKSSLAVKLAEAMRREKVFIATCIPKDREMRERVELHRKSRPSSWRTIEPAHDLPAVVRREARLPVVVIIDCLTLFVSGLLMRRLKEAEIKCAVSAITESAVKGRATVIIVSNEVGCGLVPENKLGRSFRDIAGSCNQLVAKKADRVIYMVSGIPLKIKGGLR
jgi:adenosylcobinamide kinase/adenosylcobinamide-phosphate guanylyltransferase